MGPVTIIVMDIFIVSTGRLSITRVLCVMISRMAFALLIK